MFQTLTANITRVFDRIKGRGALTETQIEEAMRDIRIALLEADVALPVVKQFITTIKQQALGQEIIKSISPGQMIVKIINDELIKLLSPNEQEQQLNLVTTPPANILMAGLQGSGKTSSSAKLALHLHQQKKKILLVSLDIYRPAAQEQLKILADSIGVDSLEIIPNQTPIEITKRAMQYSKLNGYDVVIYDSAGRLHIDLPLIEELKNVADLINPTEILLVIDALIGQDAVNVATNFQQHLDLTGIILTRLDGDARGGAALSIRHTTGKPIKFLSTGEKPAQFSLFDAKRIAGRILDMGDVVSLVEQAAQLVDESELERANAKLKKGIFTLEDYISQIKMIKKLGGFSNIMKMIPGISKFANKLENASASEKMLLQQVAIVSSMTPKERRNPDLLNASRRKRIASGSGTSVQQVNVLLKQFKQISTMIKKTKGKNPASLLQSGIGKFFS